MTGEPRAVVRVLDWPSVALSRRWVRSAWRRRVTLLVGLLLPCAFLLCLAAGFSDLELLAGFPTDSAINWYVPFAVVQLGTATGSTVAIDLARDIETGFFDRLLATPVRRSVFLLAPALAALARLLPGLSLVLATAFAAGARPSDRMGMAALVPLVITSIGVTSLSAIVSAGVAYRLHRPQAVATVTQSAWLLVLVLSTSLVPLEMMTGWLRSIAGMNPMSSVLSMSRYGMVREASRADLINGSVTIGVGLMVSTWFAATSLSRLSET